MANTSNAKQQQRDDKPAATSAVTNKPDGELDEDALRQVSGGAEDSGGEEEEEAQTFRIR